MHKFEKRDAKSRTLVILAVVGLAAALTVGIFTAVRMIRKPAASKDDPKTGIVYDSSAVEGGWDNLSPEEIAEKLNEKVAEGMINISMNTAPYFENGTAEGNVMIVNESINNYPQQVEFIRNDTGEQIYQSKAIPVGSKIERAALDVELPAGTYECTAMFHNLDPVSGEIIGTAGAIINNYHQKLIIKNKEILTMKNTKKIISLVLAICMLASLAISASAANTVDASGGTGTSSVTLSSTADGSIGGDPAATKMSVTVPTVLPIAVGTDGTVSTATDAKIVNNSFGAVKVNSVSIEAAQGWSLAAFGDKATLAHEKVNSNKFGFSLCLGDGEKKLTDDKNASKQTLLTDAIEGCFMSGVGDTSANSIGIAYDAIVTPVSEAVTNTAIASVLFIIAWDAV
ncbi:MAG: hypothetical protein ACLUN5_08845 [Oscillospiraceae bacterium]